MTFPVVEQVKVTAFGADATAHLVLMPDTVNAGELLIVGFVNDGNASVTLPGGWTKLTDAIFGVAVRFSLYGKVASGSEDGTTVDFVTSVAEHAAAQCWRISGWGGSLLDHVNITVPSMPASANANPIPIFCGAPWHASKDTLWIAMYGADDDDAVSVYPTNYSNNQTYTPSGTGTATCSMAGASRNNAVSFENPSTFTIAASEEHIAFVIAVAPADVATAVGDGFPQVVSGTVTWTANATSHPIQMPATVAAGDLLVVLYTNDGTATVTTPGGWSLLNEILSTSARISVFALDAAGTEGGTTVDFVTSATEEIVAIVFRILASTWSGDLANDVDISADASASSTTPDATTVTAGWGSANNLYFTGFGMDQGAGALWWPSALPASYGGFVQKTSGAGSTGVYEVMGFRLAASSSEDAGSWTIPTEEWGAYSVAVRPAAAAAATSLATPRRDRDTAVLLGPVVGW